MNTPSLSQTNKTANMDPNSITKHYKLKLMNDFLNIKYLNPKLKQSEIASQLSMSASSIQRQKDVINMLSPYRTQPNNTNKRSKKVKKTDFDNNLHDETDVERPRMTSSDLKRPQSTSNGSIKITKTKNNLKGGSVHENTEINEHYLDKILKNNNT